MKSLSQKAVESAVRRIVFLYDTGCRFGREVIMYDAASQFSLELPDKYPAGFEDQVISTLSELEKSGAVKKIGNFWQVAS